jgi:hypothetical protein
MASIEPNRLCIEDHKWIGIVQPDEGIFRFEERAAILRPKIDRFISNPFIASSIIHAGLIEDFQNFSNLSREIRRKDIYPFFELMVLQLINNMSELITKEQMLSKSSALLLQAVNKTLPFFLSEELDETYFKNATNLHPDVACLLLEEVANKPITQHFAEQASCLIEWFLNTGSLRKLVKFPDLQTYPDNLKAIINSAHIYPILGGWRLSFSVASQNGDKTHTKVKNLDFNPIDLEAMLNDLTKQFHPELKSYRLLARAATPSFEINEHALVKEYLDHNFPIGYMAAWYLCIEIHKHRHAYLAEERAIRETEAQWFLFLCCFQGSVLKDRNLTSRQVNSFLSQAIKEDQTQQKAERTTLKVTKSYLPFFPLTTIGEARRRNAKIQQAADAEITAEQVSPKPGKQ